MKVSTFIKAASRRPDGYLSNGMPYIRAETLARLEKEEARKRLVPVQHVVRKTAPDFLTAVAHAMKMAKTADERWSIAHRTEQVVKAMVRDLVEEPWVGNEEKLAFIDKETKNLMATGRFKTTTEACNQAQRNWVLQGNSGPGQ